MRILGQIFRGCCTTFNESCGRAGAGHSVWLITAPGGSWRSQDHRRTLLGPTDAGRRGAGMPYGRCVIYSFTGDAQEVIEKSRAGILPIFKRQSGFLAYGVMVDHNQIISTSAWNSEGDAKSADEAAKQGASENMDANGVHSFIGNYACLEFAQQ